MFETVNASKKGHRLTPALVGIVAMMFAASTAGAAERVVLGEYFSSAG